MCQDTLFWLFSTISQTMAALIAVVGVVVVFRIDHMSRSVTRLIDVNLDSLKRIKDRGALRSEAEALDKFAKHYDVHKQQDIDGHDDLATEGKVVGFWRSSEKQFAHIKLTLKSFFVFGTATIWLCLVAIPFTASISSYRNFSLFIIVVVLLGSTVTLVFAALTFYSQLGKFLIDHKGEHITKDMIK